MSINNIEEGTGTRPEVEILLNPGQLDTAYKTVYIAFLKNLAGSETELADRGWDFETYGLGEYGGINASTGMTFSVHNKGCNLSVRRSKSDNEGVIFAEHGEMEGNHDEVLAEIFAEGKKLGRIPADRVLTRDKALTDKHEKLASNGQSGVKFFYLREDRGSLKPGGKEYEYKRTKPLSNSNNAVSGMFNMVVGLKYFY